MPSNILTEWKTRKHDNICMEAFAHRLLPRFDPPGMLGRITQAYEAIPVLAGRAGPRQPLLVCVCVRAYAPSRARTRACVFNSTLKEELSRVLIYSLSEW